MRMFRWTDRFCSRNLEDVNEAAIHRSFFIPHSRRSQPRSTIATRRNPPILSQTNGLCIVVEYERERTVSLCGESYLAKSGTKPSREPLTGGWSMTRSRNVENAREAAIGQIESLIELLHRKWTVRILCEMRDHPVRLSHLKRVLPAASKKGLTASLRSLEASRFVVRRDLSATVLHVEYELTPQLRVHLRSLLDYLNAWTVQIERPQVQAVLSDVPDRELTESSD